MLKTIELVGAWHRHSAAPQARLVIDGWHEAGGAYEPYERSANIRTTIKRGDEVNDE